MSVPRPPPILARPHALEVLYLLTVEPARALRFSELRALLRVAPNSLASALRDLVDAGLLARESFATIPPRVEYHATAPALDLAPLLARVRPASAPSPSALASAERPAKAAP